MKPEINKAIIFDYFSGRTTDFQKQQIEAWAADPTNRELFFKWLWEWERHHNQYPADPEAGLKRHWSRMEATSLPENIVPKAKEPALPAFIMWRRGLVAAMFLLMTGAGGWLLRDEILFRTYSTAYGEIRKVVLADSSRVILNANSELKVPRFSFGARSREVYLKGEAGFDVTRDPGKKRFVVKTEAELDVVVLGTSFNVYARTKETRIMLSEGKVQLNYQRRGRAKQWAMQPGDLATLKQNGEIEVRKTAEPSVHSAWKFHRFDFDNTPLTEIAAQLEERFGVKVTITNPDLAALTMSGSFPALEAEELIQLLCEASGRFNYRKPDHNTIVVSDK